MEKMSINQAELELVIRDSESSNMRVSCDFTIHAGVGEHVMFYFTDIYLGSPNITNRLDKSCIEPRDVNGEYESVPKGMRAIICSLTEVELVSRVYTTIGNALSIRFYRNRGFSMTAHFKMVVTLFRLGSCRTSERKCNNDRCIAHEIVCNNHNPCGDNSDCPTGLEHLSSWAMSGIVILALLSGGIIVIMGTVCLQRNGRKQNDWDDNLSTGVGVGIRSNNDNNVEMIDVAKSSASKSHSRHDDPHSLSCGHFQIMSEKVPFYNDNPQLISESTESINEHEKLIRNHESSHESDVTVDLFQNGGIIGDKSDTITTSVSSYELPCFAEGAAGTSPSFQLQPEVAPKGTLQPEVVNTQLKHSHSDAFSFSENSLVLTDSDSGHEYDRPLSAGSHKEKKKSKHVKIIAPSSQNGKLLHKADVVFGGFKPPPPPYGYVVKHKSAFDISANDLRTSHGE